MVNNSTNKNSNNKKYNINNDCHNNNNNNIIVNTSTDVNKTNSKAKEQQNVGAAAKQQQQQQQQQKQNNKGSIKQKGQNKNSPNKKNAANKIGTSNATIVINPSNDGNKLQQNSATNGNGKSLKSTQLKQQQQPRNWQRNSGNSYAQTVGQENSRNNKKTGLSSSSSSASSSSSSSSTSSSSSSSSSSGAKVQSNLFIPKPFASNYAVIKKDSADSSKNKNINNSANLKKQSNAATADQQPAVIMNAADEPTAGHGLTCLKCSSPTCHPTNTVYSVLRAPAFVGREYRKSKSYAGSNRSGSSGSGGGSNNKYRRSSFDRNFAERNRDFVPIAPPEKPIPSETNIACVLTDVHKITLIQRMGKLRRSYPLMQCGTLEEETPDSTFHQQRSQRMDVFQIDDGFHSDGGTETPPPSPSSGSSIASTSDHGSLDSVDTGGAQRLAVLSFEQVRKLNDVMDDTVYIHGRGNFPTLEVKLKDLVNLVRRKLESDISAGGAGVVVKDVRLNGGAASHVLASEDQPFNDLDLIYAIELTSSRHFDRVKNAVLNTLMDLLPDSTSKHRIMPCALKEAYVGKMVKVNNNNDGDRWSLISLGSKRGHKNVELKFVDTMRRQFEFTVDSFQIVLDSLLLFYDCAALPISENFYPTVVGESVYGDFQEAMYHLQKKLISTRQPEEIRGGGLLKYCNLLVRNFTPIDPQHIKILERYMCSRFFIDFPDINTQTLKLDGYLADHFCGADEEPLQYQYLMHLREVVEMSTVCLMGHERRQTLLLIQYLAAQVLYKEHRKQQAQAEEQYQQQQQQQHQQQQQQHHQQQQPQQQQHQQIVELQHAQPIYVQQPQQPPPQQLLTAAPTELYCTTVTETSATTGPPPPQTIQIPSGPLGLIYANGVYYAPVIPTTICTCNSTWLST